MTKLRLAIPLCVLAVASGCSTAPSGGTAHSALPSASATAPAGSQPSASHSSRQHTAKARLRITFVDVGQGDAIVIRSGGWTGLIDGGPPGAGGAVAAALAGSGARRIDCLVITHPHADHIGGLPGVIARFRPAAPSMRAPAPQPPGAPSTQRCAPSALTCVGCGRAPCWPSAS